MVRTVRGAGAHTRARLLAARGASGTPSLRGPTPRTATHASLPPAQARPGSSMQAVKRASQASAADRGASGRKRDGEAAGGTAAQPILTSLSRGKVGTTAMQMYFADAPMIYTSGSAARVNPVLDKLCVWRNGLGFFTYNVWSLSLLYMFLLLLL